MSQGRMIIPASPNLLHVRHLGALPFLPPKHPHWGTAESKTWDGVKSPYDAVFSVFGPRGVEPLPVTSLARRRPLAREFLTAVNQSSNGRGDFPSSDPGLRVLLFCLLMGRCAGAKASPPAWLHNDIDALDGVSPLRRCLLGCHQARGGKEVSFSVSQPAHLLLL